MEIELYKKNEIQINKIEIEIRDAESIQDIKEKIYPKITGILEMLKSAGLLTIEQENKLRALKSKAELKLAKLLSELEKNIGGDRKSNNYQSDIMSSWSQTLKDFNINDREARRLQELKNLKENDIDELEKKANEEGKKLLKKNLFEKVKKDKNKEKEKNDKINNYKKKAKEYKSDAIQIYKNDFRNYSKKIDDNSIDLILTDPPYPKEYLDLWQDLFIIAERILKPSAFLICYSGQMYLDKIFKMKNDLIYYWMCNIVFSKKPLIMGRNVINEWKPILIFQKKPFKKLSKTINDTLSFEYSERNLHNKNWGQTIKPFEFLLEYFSEINNLVYEPFAGSGTTLLACQNKKRKCIGVEIEKEYIDLIKGRLNENLLAK